MNVDEAMAYTRRDKDQGFWSDDMHNAMVTLATEVERLRAELAAAKAASVVPVITIDCYTLNHEIHIACRSLQDCHKLSLWLRDRIKNTPFAT